MSTFVLVGGVIAVGLFGAALFALFKQRRALGGELTVPVPFAKGSLHVASMGAGILILALGLLALAVIATAGDVYMDTNRWLVAAGAVVLLLIGVLIIWRLPASGDAEISGPAGIKVQGGYGLVTLTLAVAALWLLANAFPKGVMMVITDDVGGGTCIVREDVSIAIRGENRARIVVGPGQPSGVAKILVPGPGDYAYRLDAVADVELPSGAHLTRTGEGLATVHVDVARRDFRVLSRSLCSAGSTPPGERYPMVLCATGHCPARL